MEARRKADYCTAVIGELLVVGGMTVLGCASQVGSWLVVATAVWAVELLRCNVDSRCARSAAHQPDGRSRRRETVEHRSGEQQCLLNAFAGCELKRSEPR